MLKRFKPTPDPPVWTTRMNTVDSREREPLTFEELTHYQVKDLVKGILNMMINVPEKDAWLEIYCEGELRARLEVFPNPKRTLPRLDESA